MKTSNCDFIARFHCVIFVFYNFLNQLWPGQLYEPYIVFLSFEYLFLWRNQRRGLRPSGIYSAPASVCALRVCLNSDQSLGDFSSSDHEEETTCFISPSSTLNASSTIFHFYPQGKVERFIVIIGSVAHSWHAVGAQTWATKLGHIESLEPDKTPTS